MADDRLNEACVHTSMRPGNGLQRGADAQGLGRSRGGLSTKIHATTDALGNPERLVFGPGQRNDMVGTLSERLVKLFEHMPLATAPLQVDVRPQGGSELGRTRKLLSEVARIR
jgi:hypothetical protein